MFVAENAKEMLLTERKDRFLDEYVLPMMREAAKLGIAEGEMNLLITKAKEGIKHEP